MGLREFVARENLYEFDTTGKCRGFTAKYVAAEAVYFGLKLPLPLLQYAPNRRK